MTAGPLIAFMRESRAAAAVEMALILPMAFALLFTCFEGGAYMWTEHKVVKGVREGARFAGRQNFDNFSCDSADITDADVTARIQRVVRTGRPEDDTQIKPRFEEWTDNGTVSVIVSCDGSTTSGIYREMEGGGRRVLVSAVVEYPSLFSTLGFGSNQVYLRAQSQAAVMGL